MKVGKERKRNAAARELELEAQTAGVRGNPRQAARLRTAAKQMRDGKIAAYRMDGGREISAE